MYSILQLNGVNLLAVQTRDVYGYGLYLMDALFTRREMAVSLLYKTYRSAKPELDPERVAKLFGELLHVNN